MLEAGVLQIAAIRFSETPEPDVASLDFILKLKLGDER
jgi:hypothetical protein